MRKMKKLASLLLAMVMVFAMTATAFAAERQQTPTTISVDTNDTRSYTVYQIFTGDLAVEGEGESKTEILSNIVWGKNGTGYVAGQETQNKVSDTILNELVRTNGLEDTKQLEVIKKYVKLASEPFGTVSKNQQLSAPTGYYLFVDQGAVGEGEAYSLYVVEVVGPTTIAPKKGNVTSQKKVDDKNDSNTSEDATVWQDSADYDIGDAVPFQLKGTVPADYANYQTYYYAFHDVQSAGLTFNATSVKVYVKNGDETTSINSGYRVVTEGLTDGCTFEVIFDDLKTISSVAAGSTITVEYTSTLNENSVIGSTGNPNEMYLEYSNNPNWVAGPEYDGIDNDGDGQVDEDNEKVPGKENSDGPGNDGIDNDGDGKVDEDDEKDEPTGNTPNDKVIVFTYKVVVNKVHQTGINEDGEPVFEALKGAGFTLYKKNANGEYVAVGAEVKGSDLTTFEWLRVDDGDYKLVETTTPPGYNKIDSIEFTITATHDVTADDPKLLTLTGGDKFTGEVDANQKLTGTLSGNVENKAGTVLPETGGIGTTIFYLVGAVLVLGSVIVMITKKRMSTR